MNACRLLCFVFLAFATIACETVCEFSPIQPDGDNTLPDGDQPDGDIPDGDKPDGDTPDGDLPDGDTPDGDMDGDTDSDTDQDAEEDVEDAPDPLPYAGHLLIEWTRDGLWRYDIQNPTGSRPLVSAALYPDLDSETATHQVGTDNQFANPPRDAAYLESGTILWTAYRPSSVGFPAPQDSTYFLRRMRKIGQSTEVRYHAIDAPSVTDAQFIQAGLLPTVGLENNVAAVLLAYAQILSENDAFLITQAHRVATTASAATPTPMTVPLYLRLPSGWRLDGSTRILSDGTHTWINAGESLHAFNADGTINATHRPNYRRTGFLHAQVLDMDLHAEKNWIVLLSLLTFTNNRTELVLSLHSLNAPTVVVAEHALGDWTPSWRLAISPSGTYALALNADPASEQTLYLMHLTNSTHPVRALPFGTWGRPVLRGDPDRLLAVTAESYDEGLTTQTRIESLPLDDLWGNATPAGTR